MPSINVAFESNTEALNTLTNTVLNAVNNSVIDASKIRGKVINPNLQNPVDDVIMEYQTATGMWEQVTPTAFADKLNLDIPQRITDLDDAPSSFQGKEGNFFMVQGTGAGLVVPVSTYMADMPGVVDNSVPVGGKDSKYKAKPYPAKFNIVEATTPNFIAKPGESIWFDTSGGTAACFLPNSGVERGDTILFRGNSLPTNNAFVRRNGQQINGASVDLVLDTNNQETLMIFFGGSIGWRAASLSAASGASPSPSPTPSPGTPVFGYQIVNSLVVASSPSAIAADSSTGRLLYAAYQGGANHLGNTISTNGTLVSSQSQVVGALREILANEVGDIIYAITSRLEWAFNAVTNNVSLWVFNAASGTTISQKVVKAYSSSQFAPGGATGIVHAQFGGVDSTNGLVFVFYDGYDNNGITGQLLPSQYASTPAIVAYDVNLVNQLSTTYVTGVSQSDGFGRGCVNPATTRLYLPVKTKNAIYVMSYATSNGGSAKIGEYATDINPFIALYSANYNRLVVICNPGWVNVFDLSLGVPVAMRVSFTGTPSDAVIRGDDVFITCSSTNTVVVVKITGTPYLLATIPVGTYPSGIAKITSAGVDTLYVTNRNSNTISVIA